MIRGVRRRGVLEECKILEGLLLEKLIYEDELR
jgi:hypothetical protein